MHKLLGCVAYSVHWKIPVLDRFFSSRQNIKVERAKKTKKTRTVVVVLLLVFAVAIILFRVLRDPFGGNTIKASNGLVLMNADNLSSEDVDKVADGVVKSIRMNPPMLKKTPEPTPAEK